MNFLEFLLASMFATTLILTAEARDRKREREQAGIEFFRGL